MDSAEYWTARNEIEERFSENYLRVLRLLNAYRSQGHQRGRKHIADADLLRAATVFLHAALEELIRSLEVLVLPLGIPTALTGIPLADPASGKTQDKITLADLANHRGSSVEAVVRHSVERALERRTYSDQAALVSALVRIGLDLSPLQPHLSDIAALIARRHNIVHRADRNAIAGPGQQKAKSLSARQVRAWAKAVDLFSRALLSQIPSLPTNLGVPVEPPDRQH